MYETALPIDTSTSPSSTLSARSDSRCLIEASSTCGRPRPPRLPPLDALRRRAAAWSGWWDRQCSSPRIACAPQRPPSALIPLHLAIAFLPPPPISLFASLQLVLIDNLAVIGINIEFVFVYFVGGAKLVHEVVEVHSRFD